MTDNDEDYTVVPAGVLKAINELEQGNTATKEDLDEVLKFTD